MIIIVKLDSVKREFLAIVLAGFGNELLPLTGDYGDEPCPKALLPVANKPMLEYTLSWIEKSGIRDVLLICPTSHRPSIYHYIHSDVTSSSLRIDLQTFDESQDGGVGTCTLLRHFSSRVPEDFVVVPCDFIPPPTLPLSMLLNKFRVDSVAEGCVATTCWYSAYKPDKAALVDEWGPLPAPSPIIWDDLTGTLLYIDTSDDVDRNTDELELRMAMLSRHPRAILSSSLQDSHVYVCRRSVLDLLHIKRHFDGFRQEFLPWLCRVQYQRAKREKYKHVLNPVIDTTSQRLALRHSTLLSRRLELAGPIQESTMSIPPSPTDSDAEQDLKTGLKIGVVIHRAESGFALRVNTVHNFLEINRRALNGVTYALPSDPKNRSLIDQKAQIASDTIIGDFTQVSERTTIKKSIIGRHCVIGKGAKISASVLLDHCVIEDGAKLDGCILGKNTKVGTKSELARCVTQAGYDIGPGDIVKGEKLDISDWTAAVGDGIEGDESSECDG